MTVINLEKYNMFYCFEHRQNTNTQKLGFSQLYGTKPCKVNGYPPYPKGAKDKV
jgi:hypothetical protein